MISSHAPSTTRSSLLGQPAPGDARPTSGQNGDAEREALRFWADRDMRGNLPRMGGWGQPGSGALGFGGCRRYWPKTRASKKLAHPPVGREVAVMRTWRPVVEGGKSLVWICIVSVVVERSMAVVKEVPFWETLTT